MCALSVGLMFSLFHLSLSLLSSKHSRQPHSAFSPLTDSLSPRLAHCSLLSSILLHSRTQSPKPLFISLTYRLSVSTWCVVFLCPCHWLPASLFFFSPFICFCYPTFFTLYFYFYRIRPSRFLVCTHCCSLHTPTLLSLLLHPFSSSLYPSLLLFAPCFLN